MTTFLQMVDRVYAVLRDTERVYVQTHEVEDWLNEGYLDLCTRLGLIETTATGTTTASGNVTLPSTCSRVLAFYLDTTDTSVKSRVEFNNDEVFLDWKLSGTEPPVTLGRVTNGVVETYPAAESTGYTLEYVATPAAMDTADDVPLVPEDYIPKIINYARAHAKWKEGEAAEGEIYYGLFLEGLPMQDSKVHKDRPGPIAMVPQPSYWDIDT